MQVNNSISCLKWIKERKTRDSEFHVTDPQVSQYEQFSVSLSLYLLTYLFLSLSLSIYIYIYIYIHWTVTFHMLFFFANSLAVFLIRADTTFNKIPDVSHRFQWWFYAPCHSGFCILSTQASHINWSYVQHSMLLFDTGSIAHFTQFSK